jgi:putative hemolysin
VLGYGEARRLADAIAALSGPDVMAEASRRLQLRVAVRGLDRLPAEGPLILAGNHPTGIADGIALHDALSPVRPDLGLFANADALRVAPRLAEVVIPVEWTRRTRAGARRLLAQTGQALAAGRALAIFPSGRLARRALAGPLIEQPWRPSALALARRFEVPVLPMHLAGPPSTLFHLLHPISTELRDITLFHELLNKRGRRFTLTLGHPVDPRDLGPDLGVASAAMRAYVTQVLPTHPDRPFAV